MNGINSIRLDINTAKYYSTSAKNRVTPVEEVKNSTEAEKKKQFKTQLINEFDSGKNPSQKKSELILSNSDNRFYRANLLHEIVNKMSGLENKPDRGQYIEYYA